jgi:hypothetical protein
LEDEDKRLTTQVRAQIPARTGTSGIVNPTRRKVPATGAVDTPDTTRAMAGGSDRLLRSQSKTQGATAPAAPPARSGSHQQNWY